MARLFFLLMLIAVPVFAQTATKDSETLQTLLAEVRELRHSIETLTVASQRTQIALHALQMQDATVARSLQRLDSVRTRCSGEEGHRAQIAAEVQHMEAALTSGKISSSDTKAEEARLANTKKALETSALTVQTCQAGEAEAANQLRNDQAALAEIRDRIDRLDKTLAGSTAGK